MSPLCTFAWTWQPTAGDLATVIYKTTTWGTFLGVKKLTIGDLHMTWTLQSRIFLWLILLCLWMSIWCPLLHVNVVDRLQEVHLKITALLPPKHLSFECRGFLLNTQNGNKWFSDISLHASTRSNPISILRWPAWAARQAYPRSQALSINLNASLAFFIVLRYFPTVLLVLKPGTFWFWAFTVTNWLQFIWPSLLLGEKCL